jgi:hypothetical protein
MTAMARPRLTGAYLRSVISTFVMLLGGRLALPRQLVGRRLRFADGTLSRVYRETVRRDGRTTEPTLVVIRFRLRLTGHSRVLHALFRVESLANTPFFAGFAGFRSKLWCTDVAGGTYHGVYEWDGPDRARRYATAMTALLRPLSVPGSVAYHVEPGVRRDEFVDATDPRATGDAWWQLDAEVAP